MNRARDAGAVGAAAAGIGAALTAAVASACCAGPALAPLLLSVVGAGALADVAGLRPYAPFLFALSAGMLAFGFRQAYRKPACAASRVTRGVAWFGAVLWFASLFYALYGFLHE